VIIGRSYQDLDGILNSYDISTSLTAQNLTTESHYTHNSTSLPGWGYTDNFCLIQPEIENPTF